MARGKPEGDREVQAKTDAAEEQGFLGTKVDPLPNSAYSLESGPDAPVPANSGRVPQHDLTDLQKKEG